MKNHSHRTIKTQKRQQGFTLVEIMVAIALSLLLIAGVIQIYISSKESYRVQSELARLQENQRIAMEFLQNNIQQAGFKPYGAPPINNRIEVTDSDNGINDSIVVRFTSATDCRGQATPDGIAVNTFFIQQNADGFGQLMCRGNGNALAQPIADGIESMQILLGDNSNFANDTPAAQTPDRYVNASTLDNTLNVVSVRIALLTRTEDPIKQQPVTETFTILDTIFSTAGNPDQFRRVKRQVVTTTVPLRNNV
jgi:type IV pilus assembly protein PilW